MEVGASGGRFVFSTPSSGRDTSVCSSAWCSLVYCVAVRVYIYIIIYSIMEHQQADLTVNRMTLLNCWYHGRIQVVKLKSREIFTFSFFSFFFLTDLPYGCSKPSRTLLYKLVYQRSNARVCGWPADVYFRV